MAYKFEQLELRQLALNYIAAIYSLAGKLPRTEDYNLKSQMIRAATSIALNIAEGSQEQTDSEQARFLGLAIRSLIETVACLQLIRRRKYLSNESVLDEVYLKSQTLVRKLQSFRKSISTSPHHVREESPEYIGDIEISSVVYRQSSVV